MNKGIWFLLLGLLCIIASLVMFQVGRHSTHLTELRDYCAVPLPLALVAFITGILHLRNRP